MQRWLEQVFADARAGRASDLAGSRVAADIAVSDRLINQALAEALGPAGGHVRAIEVQAREGAARVTVKLAKPAFLPPIPVTVTVERQPQMPADPTLVLNLAMPPGIGALAEAGLGLLKALPTGHRLEGNRLLIDVAAVLNDRGYGWVVPYVRALNVRFESGRVMHFVEVDVRT